MSFAFEAAIAPVLKELKDQLKKQSASVMQQFHIMDTDNSNQLSTEEFVSILKKFGITLPPRQLQGVIAHFDANGDGSVSIPEFSAFITGDTSNQEALKMADAVVDEAPSPMASSMPRAPRMPGMPAGSYSTGKPLTMTDALFLARMESDIENRRRDAFLVELRKDPRFKPSMLEPPKPKFKEVSVGAGPIIKSHSLRKTGLEPRRPYQWGPLGGYY